MNVARSFAPFDIARCLPLIRQETLKKEYYDIIRFAGFNYNYQHTHKTNNFLKENLSGLSSIEKQLLKAFCLDTNETTNDRLKRFS